MFIKLLNFLKQPLKNINSILRKVYIITLEKSHIVSEKVLNYSSIHLESQNKYKNTYENSFPCVKWSF